MLPGPFVFKAECGWLQGLLGCGELSSSGSLD